MAGDIGGTHTRLSMYEKQSGIDTPIFHAVYETGGFTNLNTVLQQFLTEAGQYPQEIAHAVFSIAGPVIAQKASLTNKDQTIQRESLENLLENANVELINDMEAWIRAVPLLKPEDLHVLNPGIPDPEGIKACIAPGTGLGEAVWVKRGTTSFTIASEGGHADFAPRGRQQMALFLFLTNQLDHISVERVCSGPGIQRIYDFFTQQAIPESEQITEELSAHDDPAPMISSNARLKPLESERCRISMETFVAIFGAEAGNLALRVLATGGIYLGGGIVPKIIPLLEKNGFMTAFTDKGRFRTLLERTPVYIIKNPLAALIGAASPAAGKS